MDFIPEQILDVESVKKRKRKNKRVKKLVIDENGAETGNQINDKLEADKTQDCKVVNRDLGENHLQTELTVEHLNSNDKDANSTEQHSSRITDKKGQKKLKRKKKNAETEVEIQSVDQTKMDTRSTEYLTQTRDHMNGNTEAREKIIDDVVVNHELEKHLVGSIHSTMNVELNENLSSGITKRKMRKKLRKMRLKEARNEVGVQIVDQTKMDSSSTENPAQTMDGNLETQQKIRDRGVTNHDLEKHLLGTNSIAKPLTNSTKVGADLTEILSNEVADGKSKKSLKRKKKKKSEVEIEVQSVDQAEMVGRSTLYLSQSNHMDDNLNAQEKIEEYEVVNHAAEKNLVTDPARRPNDSTKMDVHTAKNASNKIEGSNRKKRLKKKKNKKAKIEVEAQSVDQPMDAGSTENLTEDVKAKIENAVQIIDKTKMDADTRGDREENVTCKIIGNRESEDKATIDNETPSLDNNLANQPGLSGNSSDESMMGKRKKKRNRKGSKVKDEIQSVHVGSTECIAEGNLMAKMRNELQSIDKAETDDNETPRVDNNLANWVGLSENSTDGNMMGKRKKKRNRKGRIKDEIQSVHVGSTECIAERNVLAKTRNELQSKDKAETDASLMENLGKIAASKIIGKRESGGEETIENEAQSLDNNLMKTTGLPENLNEGNMMGKRKKRRNLEENASGKTVSNGESDNKATTEKEAESLDNNLMKMSGLADNLNEGNKMSKRRKKRNKGKIKDVGSTECIAKGNVVAKIKNEVQSTDKTEVAASLMDSLEGSAAGKTIGNEVSDNKATSENEVQSLDNNLMPMTGLAENLNEGNMMGKRKRKKKRKRGKIKDESQNMHVGSKEYLAEGNVMAKIKEEDQSMDRAKMDVSLTGNLEEKASLQIIGNEDSDDKKTFENETQSMGNSLMKITGLSENVNEDNMMGKRKTERGRKGKVKNEFQGMDQIMDKGSTEIIPEGHITSECNRGSNAEITNKDEVKSMDHSQTDTGLGEYRVEGNVTGKRKEKEKIKDEVQGLDQTKIDEGLSVSSSSSLNGEVAECSHKIMPLVTNKRKLLVLDLNGLLADIIYHSPKDRKGDAVIMGRAVFKRPFYDDFLKFCFKNFDVGIWSSRAGKITQPIVNYLLKGLKEKLLFCWDAVHCTQSGFKTLENKEKPMVFKELRKIWEKDGPNLLWKKGDYNESNTLLLDDSPYKALLNPPHTAIFPRSYHHTDENDNSLGPGGDLRVYLEGLAESESVQKHIEQHPFGIKAINEQDPSWQFYTDVLQKMARRSE